jgi:hypothetical protein
MEDRPGSPMTGSWKRPTVGRIVHFFKDTTGVPEAAVVTAVWSDTCVNITIFTVDGTVMGATSVQKRMEGNMNMRVWDWPELS